MMKTVFALMAKSIYKDSYMLVWSILLPLGLFIGLGMYHEADGYRQNVLIGSMLLSLVMGAINTSGFWTMTQRRRGVFKLLKLSMLPISRFILCSILARFMMFVLIAALLLLSGGLLFGMTIDAGGLFVLLALLAVGSVCFTSIGYAIASHARDEGMMNMMSTMCSFPMIFLSTAFYSLDQAPQWIQFLAKLNPFEYAVRIGRSAMSGGVDVTSLIVLMLFAAVCTVMAVKTFRYE